MMLERARADAPGCARCVFGLRGDLVDISTRDELCAAIAIADALKCPLRLTVSLRTPPAKEATPASKDEDKEVRKLKKEAEKEEKKRIKQAAKQAARAAEKEEEREFLRQVLNLIYSPSSPEFVCRFVPRVVRVVRASRVGGLHPSFSPSGAHS